MDQGSSRGDGGRRQDSGEVLDTRFPERGGLDIDAERGIYTVRPSRLLAHSTGCSNADQSPPIQGSRQDLLLEREDIKFGSECAEFN